MPATLYRSILALGIGVGLFVDALFGAEPPNSYGSHVVQTRPLSAEEQLKAFHLPSGFTIQLVAAEPEICKPINLAFDDAGRLYATGSIEYPYPAADAAKARDVVTRFEIDVDGRATAAKPVVSGLNIPIGLAAIGEELLVFNIRQLLRCRDGDGDGVFETKTPLIKGFGFRDTHGMVNGVVPWIDGWVYSCHGFANESTAEGVDGTRIDMQSGNTFRWKPDGSHVEHFTHGQVNPFGLAFDEWGHLFSADCHTLPAYHLLRGACYPSFGKPHDGLGFGPAIMRHSHGSTGIAGISYYEADQFPPEYRRTLFIGNPITGRINHDKLGRTGASYRAVEQPDFLKCDDPWFRPVDVKLGPDGALYIADFYNCIIGHYEVPLDHPRRDRERGRIWRIVYTGDGAKTATMPNVRAAQFDELITMLGHPNLTVRTFATERLATMELSEQQVETLDAVRSDSSGAAVGRVHALWVLARHKTDLRFASSLLDDEDPLVRAHAVKAVAERDIRETTWPDLEAICRRLDDVEPFVALAAAEALAAHPYRRNVEPLLSAWRRASASDPQLAHAVKIAMREQLADAAILKQVASAEQRAGFSIDDRQRIAEACLGIPTPEAADYVLAEITSRETKVAFPAPYVEHAARRLRGERLPQLFDYCATLASSAVDRRLAVYRALSHGLDARKLKLPDAIVVDLQSIVLELLAADDEPRVKQGLELAKEFRRGAFCDGAAKLAMRSAKFAGLRPAALDAVAACDDGRASKLFTSIIDDRSESSAMRTKAVQQLSALNSVESRAILLDRLTHADARLAVDIANTIVTSQEGAEALLDAVTSGKAASRLLQEGPVLFWMARSNPTDWNERIRKLTANLPPPDDRVGKLISARVEAFKKSRPDPARGQELFTKNCSACHRIAGKGTKIGPELDGIGRRGVERLLEDMLDPSRTVDQAFRATQLTLTDGRLLTGLVLREEGDVLVVADSQGKELRLASAEIEERATLNLSPMPANVADLVPDAEMPHLLGFLLSADKPLVPQK